MKILIKKYQYICEIVFLTISSCLVFFLSGDWVMRTDLMLSVQNSFYNFIHPQYSSGHNENRNKCEDLIVVKLDESISVLEISSLLSKIQSFHPKVIGVDIRFNEYNKVEGDSVLINQILSSNNIILPYDINNGKADLSYFINDVSDVPSGLANPIAVNNIDRFFIQERIDNGVFHKYFATVIVEKYLGENVPLLKDTSIDYSYELDEYSGGHIINDDSINFRNKIILIGISSEQEKRNVPFYETCYGVELQGYIVATMLDRTKNPISNFQTTLLPFLLICLSLIVLYIIHTFLRRWNLMFLEDWIIIALNIGLIYTYMNNMNRISLYSVQLNTIPLIVSTIVVGWSKLISLVYWIYKRCRNKKIKQTLFWIELVD